MRVGTLPPPFRIRALAGLESSSFLQQTFCTWPHFDVTDRDGDDGGEEVCEHQ